MRASQSSEVTPAPANRRERRAARSGGKIPDRGRSTPVVQPRQYAARRRG
ncbi:hypothetical protein [Amycolatopsis magusensis]|uniref:Uncharacterized protein n=1 Tax=Amycolatopsis magusensis TaxID=882444 RepID=A0ABS4PTB6_9PSEU|nr:hypothetical protein [Amycolatopsis magusensis]MBP2182063.1 hypothetical protein [Amycolatopsis magusensis]MDI5977180.1 hypothetical protein [Amycolatopsis magusensis]UJW31748.1 hypothetical protein L3Q67_42375 [Saccharothrix sp. AJ9571]